MSVCHTAYPAAASLPPFHRVDPAGTIAAIAVLLWLARFTMQLIVFRKTAKVFGERKFCALLPLFDFLQPAWNGVFKLQRKFRRKNEFMRK